jgi:CheY-like chemotaxis protein
MSVAAVDGSMAPEPPMDRRRPFVLAVDDSHDMRSILSDILEDIGCEVATAASGASALRAMSERRPDLVITDLLMPGMSGFSLRTAMLRRPEFAAIPVIVLSAYWRRPSETLDAVEVLPKPLNIERLVDAVRRLTASMEPSAD